LAGSQSVPWEAVTALVVASSAVSTFAVFVISALIDRKLAGFLQDLDDTFVRRELADERHVDHGRRIDALERKTA
jgi:hypothetical protein